MQINGVGSGHNANNHQITECIHDHSTSKKQGGAAQASSSGNQVQSQTTAWTQQEEQFSLATWLINKLAGGKKLLGKIWGESEGANQAVQSGEKNVLQTEEEVKAQIGEPREGESQLGRSTTLQEAAISTAIRQQPLENNPYFSTIKDSGREKQSMWEKTRVRFQSIAGQLTGRFAGKNSFQTGKEKSKEDLRKHSRYRQDDLEIDCILTDDSYLMDSYDRKGEYRKLSTKK